MVPLIGEKRFSEHILRMRIVMHSTPRKVADVAYLTFAGNDPERDLATTAFQRAGLSVRHVRWNDPTTCWSDYRLAIVRSTWDYIADRLHFLTVMRTIAARTILLNPADVLEWNTDKAYLRDLDAAGCPTVPTVWVPPGATLAEVAAAIPSNWHDLVVKPSIGAGGSGAMRTADRAKACAYAVNAGRALMMVQPYVESVDSTGEVSLVYIGGEYSHSVRRGPYLTPESFRRGLLVPGSADPGWQVRAVTSTTPQRELAERVIRAIPTADSLCYARVDLVAGDAGQLMVTELEACEPYLFLDHKPGAADELAASVAARLRPSGMSSRKASQEPAIPEGAAVSLQKSSHEAGSDDGYPVRSVPLGSATGP